MISLPLLLLICGGEVGFLENLKCLVSKRPLVAIDW